MSDEEDEFVGESEVIGMGEDLDIEYFIVSKLLNVLQTLGTLV
jgi:hypothetical protein